MTPRERAESLFAKMSAAAAREYVRALLADDEGTIEAMACAIYELDRVGVREWVDAPVSTREDCIACARAALGALRRKAGVE